MKRAGTEQVRLGIVGCGNVTMLRHLPALLRTPGIRVAGVCDRDSSRAQLAAARYARGVRIYESPDALVQDASMDAIAVCVPTSFHRAIAEAVLLSGKHLYLEKPPALTLHDSAAICKAAETSRGISMIGFNLRQHRLVRRALRVLEHGTLGKVTMLRSVFTSNTRLNKDAPSWRLNINEGGLLLEQAIHHFDLWRCVLRSEVEQIHAVLTHNSAGASVLARMTGNIAVTGSFSEETTETNEVEVYCERGILRLSLYEFDGLEIIPTGVQVGSISRRVDRAIKTARALPDAIRGIQDGGEYVASYRRSWEHFAACIRAGVPESPTLQDGHLALGIVLAARESAANSGAAVRVAERKD